MAPLKHEEPSNIRVTLQRLLNGESGNRKAYLDGFFHGKNSEATEQGALVLLQILEEGTCKTEDVPDLVEYVMDLAEGHPSVEPALERAFVRMTRRILSEAPKKYLRDGSYSRPEAAMLSSLLQGRGSRYARVASSEIVYQVTSAVLYPGVWVDLIKQFFWVDTIRIVPDTKITTEITTTGNPELVNLFQDHCLSGSRTYAEQGQHGIAAALFTVAQPKDGLQMMHERIRMMYERARESGQAVPLNCVEMWETRGAPHWAPLTKGRQRTAPELCRELFGEAGMSDPRFQLREPNLVEQFVIEDGKIRLTNDAFLQCVAEKLLSRGLWNDAQRIIAAVSNRKFGQGRDISSILLPAMYVADQEGRTAVAAALGQIALAAHLTATPSKTGSQWSPITHIARSITDSVYRSESWKIESEIKQYTDPFPETDGVSYLPVDPKPVPLELALKADVFRQGRTAFEVALTSYILETIKRLFNAVINQGIPLQLEIF